MFGLRMAELHKMRLERVRDPWPDFVKWRREVIDYGLARSEMFTGLIEGVLQIAHDGLIRRGMGEECYLEALWQRWKVRKNPAQLVRAVFARKGIEGLLHLCRIS